MAQQSNISIRINRDLKKQFDELCNKLGLPMSTAINMFIKTVVREQRIPIELALHIPNEETRQAIEDVENGIGLSGPFNSVEELMAALEKED